MGLCFVLGPRVHCRLGGGSMLPGWVEPGGRGASCCRLLRSLSGLCPAVVHRSRDGSLRLPRPQAAEKSPKQGAASANGKLHPLLGALRGVVSPVSSRCPPPRLPALPHGCTRAPLRRAPLRCVPAAGLSGGGCVPRGSDGGWCFGQFLCRRCCWRPSPSLSWQSGATAARSPPSVRPAPCSVARLASCEARVAAADCWAWHSSLLVSPAGAQVAPGGAATRSAGAVLP